MARLRLILGPAGSGKTETVLREAAAASLQEPLGPPLLLIVPEQQGVQIERSALARIAQLSASPDGAAATARIRVLSLTRLARLLLERAGRSYNKLSELQRRLLVFRLLEPGREREARAAVYSDLLAELALWETTPAQLRQRASELQADAARADTPLNRQQFSQLSAKLEALAAVQDKYLLACEDAGLDFRPAPALIPELLSEDNWPQLAATRIWIDGFAGFTPAEESALAALLRACETLTPTVLLDPRRRFGPLGEDGRDWYAPGRALFERWQLLAQRSGAAFEEPMLLEAPSAWPPGSPLARLAQDLPQSQLSSGPPAGGYEDGQHIELVVCADEREETEAAAQQIRALTLPEEMGGSGLRYGQISVVLRDLQRYAPLFQTIFRDYGIPFFLDQRRALTSHPAVELLRGGLRLALGLAGSDDVAALLRCGLLPEPVSGTQREAADELLAYARRHGLRPGQWLSAEDWRFHGQLLGGEDSVDDERLKRREQQLARLNRWRSELLAPVRMLSSALAAQEGALSVREALARAWSCLFDAGVAAKLEAWAQSAELQTLRGHGAAHYQPDQAELHRSVWGALAELLEALDAVAGDLRLPAAELCAWLEAGLAALDTGFPPPLLDSVLVTQIDRGRHGQVEATLLLGLSEDQWPPSQGEAALFSDAERELINGGAAAAVPEAPAGNLLAAGAREQASREPFLFLVAVTRPATRLYLSRPAGGNDGRIRPPSAYLRGLQDAIGLGERPVEAAFAERLQNGSLFLPAAELAARLAQAPLSPASGGASLEQQLWLLAPDAMAAALWSRDEFARAGQPPRLEPELLRALLGRGDGLLLRASASQMETFALCPFRHFSRYFLRVSEEQPPLFDARTMGSFYHSLFERLMRRLQALAPELGWTGMDAGLIEGEAAVVLTELGRQLEQETDYQRVEFLLLRARALLAQHAQLLTELLQEEGRVPLAAELAFGDQPGAGLPPLSLPFAGGRLLLSGKIDRVDLDSAGQATVVDYKLGQRSFKDSWLLAGAQIQMYVYLLALACEDNARQRPGQLELDLQPHSASYQSIEASWNDKSELVLNSSSRELAEAAEGEWEASRRSDLPPRLKPSLELVRRLLGGLAGDIAAGSIAVSPLRDGPQWRACSSCDFQSICRFDPLSHGRYRSVALAGQRNLERSGLQPLTLEAPARRGGQAGRAKGKADPGGGR